MGTNFSQILRATTAGFAVAMCLQTAAHAADNAVYSYHDKEVTTQDIVARFLGGSASAAEGMEQFRTRGIRIHGEESRHVETRTPDRTPVKVSAKAPEPRAASDASKASPPREAAGGCPKTDASVALPIPFALNSAVLEAEAYAKLRQMVGAMKSSALGSCKFSVEGHTDASGSDDLNLRLSQRRAYAVREFLVSMDIEPSRLAPVGKGEAEPLPKSDPLAPENRRVQFRIVSN